MIGELRGAAMLEGARGQPPCDLDALAAALSKLSLFAAAQARRVHQHRHQPAPGAPEGRRRGGARRADPDPRRGCPAIDEVTP